MVNALDEITRICDTMNALEENSIGFFHFSDSLTFFTQDEKTVYVIQWNSQNQRYEVSTSDVEVTHNG